MNHQNLLKSVHSRKKAVSITIKNLATLSGLSRTTVARFLEGQNSTITTIKKITSLLGLDSEGNEIISANELRERRAKEKAIYMVSLVQDTCSLERQGLENEQLNVLIEQAKEMFLNQYSKNLWAS